MVDPSTSGGTIRPTTTTSWNEGSVTWANAPPSAASPTASIGAVKTGTWVTVDLTSFVTGDGVVSLRVSSTNSNGADYASKEGAATTKPQLIVTTGGGGSTDTENPTIPSNLQATASSGRVDLSWTRRAKRRRHGYRVLRDGNLIATIGAATSYTEDGGAIDHLQLHGRSVRRGREPLGAERARGGHDAGLRWPAGDVHPNR